MFKVYGKAESDPGDWLPFGNSEVRVRVVLPKDGKVISKRHGKEMFVERNGLRVPTVERTLQQMEDLNIEVAMLALSDVRGPLFEPQPEDEEARTMLAKLFDDQDVKIGEVYKLEGKLGSNLRKRWLIDQKLHGVVDLDFIKEGSPELFEDGKLVENRWDLASFLLVAHQTLAKRRGQEEKEARGNS